MFTTDKFLGIIINITVTIKLPIPKCIRVTWAKETNTELNTKYRVRGVAKWL